MKKLSLIARFGLLTASILVCTLLVHAQKSPQLSDPEVASVAVTANQVDIDYANIAMERSKNEEVLNFARTMANDHKSVIDQAVALANKLGVTPKSNQLTQKLLADAEKTKTQLSAVTGHAFDKAYIDNEVAYHKAVIEVVEGQLIPTRLLLQLSPGNERKNCY